MGPVLHDRCWLKDLSSATRHRVTERLLRLIAAVQVHVDALCDPDVSVPHYLGEHTHRHAAMRGETREGMAQLVKRQGLRKLGLVPRCLKPSHLHVAMREWGARPRSEHEVLGLREL